ncbi:ORF6N domain-containing protein [Muricauda sp. 334s03]|uniref:ORF6N domain-containing protein n=1 Tax=Flagellimonas yonaguniensis TaxID=3031325 RepID=A0ABT5XZE0_9FLAO|nr:ORF6N domain-containing protein [[Muricauda] yonaguniensis]MDF0716559.1 ORF6N domain-containing protein [[Muricauda] yonaguniensis]
MTQILPENIAETIQYFRGHKVILDFHLAKLYEVENRSLKQQVKRNLDRFPKDFMFELEPSEIDDLVSRNVIQNKRVLGGAAPMAFTEQGVAMISSVLRSQKALDVNIAIMRTFVQLRRLLESNKELEKQILSMERKYDQQFKVVFDAIKDLIVQERKPRKSIGYKATTV